MAELFQARSFPLSGAGAAAQALAGAGGLSEFGKGIGAVFKAIADAQFKNKTLAELGYDDTTAALAGAQAKTETLPAIPELVPGAGGVPESSIVIPPSAMKIGDLLARKTAAGAQAEVATAPTLGQILGGDKIAGTALEAYENAPYPIAQKLGQLARSFGSSPANLYVNKTAWEKYQKTGNIEDMPILSPFASSPDDVKVDARASAQLLRQQEQQLKSAAQIDLNSWRTLMAGKFKNDADATLFQDLLKGIEPWQNMARLGYMTEANLQYPDALKYIAQAKKIMAERLETTAGKVPGKPGMTQKNPYPAVTPQPKPSAKPAPEKPAFMLFSPEDMKALQNSLQQ